MTSLTARLELASSKNVPSVRAPAVASAASKHVGPSNVTLFLTNLRLLDLDHKKDWPGISTATFSSKNTQQNQKGRVQCVEWALFQLFAIWDPAETKEKLQPFFPPLEPLQSINLRTALFRSLDYAKKNGVLGRDAVLRKTMLDECKGDRLEEVLAVFSTVVLKKVVTETMNMDATALQLATENFSYFGERTVLTALILSHKVSLSRGLKNKGESTMRYQEFAGLLEEKRGELLRRHNLLKEGIASRMGVVSLSQQDKDRLCERVQKSWAGSNEWLETICHGDGRFERDGMLARPYDETWKQVTDGTLSEAENKKPKGLLEQLDARVQEQQQRLEKWREFEKSFSKPGTPKPQVAEKSTAEEQCGIDLGFTVHQNIQFQKGNPTAKQNTKPVLSDDYARILHDMKTELESVGKYRSEGAGGRGRQSFVPDEDFDTSLAELQRDISTGDISNKSGKQDSAPQQYDSDVDWQSHEEDSMDETEGEVQKEVSEEALASSETVIPSIEIESESEEESSFTPIPPRIRGSPESGVMFPKLARSMQLSPQASPSPSPRPRIIEESEADRILNSMAAASPSPVKRARHKLSLAERTQLSMSRSSRSSQSLSENLLADDPEDFPDLAIRSIISPPAHDNRKLDAHVDLIERTRQSMAGFASAQKKAQLEKKESLRSAKKSERALGSFPPPLSTPDEEDAEQEETNKFERHSLIESHHEVDYESAFKSRPKIALSPSMSPVKWDDGDTIELSSPLGRMRR